MQRTLYILLSATRCRCWAWSSSSPWYSVPSSPISSRPSRPHRGAVVRFREFQPRAGMALQSSAPTSSAATSSAASSYAFRISLLLGAVVLAIAVPIGVTIGLVAGYLGGWTEYVLMPRDRRLPVDPAAGAGHVDHGRAGGRR